MGEQHTLIAKLIHWLFIPLYVYGIFKQVDDISQLEDKIEGIIGRKVSFYLASKSLADREHIILFRAAE